MALDVDILTKLVRRGLIGERYAPKEKSFSGISKDEHGDAKEVLGELVKDGLVLKHKGGKCISINPGKKREVKEILRGGDVDEYIIDRI